MTYTKHHTEGLVLKIFDRGEADRGYYLFTRELGLVYATARGVRKHDSKLKSGLQQLSHSDVSLVRARDAWRVTDAHARGNWRAEDAGKRTLTRRMLTLLLRFLQGEERNTPLFESVVGGLSFLSREALSREDMRNVETLTVLRMLYHLGYLDAGWFGYLVGSRHVNDMLLFETGRLRGRAVDAINRALHEAQL